MAAAMTIATTTLSRGFDRRGIDDGDDISIIGNAITMSRQHLC
jgi:hypothetical protein